MNNLSITFEELDNDMHVVNFDRIEADHVEAGGYIGIRQEEGSLQIEIFNKAGDLISTVDLPYSEMI